MMLFGVETKEAAHKVQRPKAEGAEVWQHISGFPQGIAPQGEGVETRQLISSQFVPGSVLPT